MEGTEFTAPDLGGNYEIRKTRENRTESGSAGLGRATGVFLVFPQWRSGAEGV